MLLLDLFCCAGGAAKGYARAGFTVVGVDIEPQPRYPFEFIQADALNLGSSFLDRFDAIHASPPCQGYSQAQHINGNGDAHPKLIEPTRELLRSTGKPYVIENVVGAPLLDPIMLCGMMFGLKVYRHRLFECSFWAMVPSHPAHRGTTLSTQAYSSFETGADFICVAGHNFKREDGASAMEIDWPARREEIAQMIPPAYTAFIGKSLALEVRGRHAA